jgi:nitrite reductase/ring-hydroxylating ferredoxin subunit
MKVPLFKVDEIPDEGVKTVDFFGCETLTLKIGGESKAILNYCMHLGGSLKRENNKLVCAWHGAEFDCAKGTCLKGPARFDSQLIVLPTRVEHGVLTYVYGESSAQETVMPNNHEKENTMNYMPNITDTSVRTEPSKSSG